MMLQTAGKGGLHLGPLPRWSSCVKAPQDWLRGGPWCSCVVRREELEQERRGQFSQLISQVSASESGRCQQGTEGQTRWV